MRPADDQRREAFARYVVPEIEILLRVATSLVPRPADAEDLVQDTLVRAYRSIERFDGAHPRAWLLTIMRNTQVHRTRRRRPELLRDPDLAMAQLSTAPAANADPEQVVVGAQFDATVLATFAALPEKFRCVVQLVDIDGLSYAETAELLGVPQGTVLSRLHRARTRIRTRLAAAGLAPTGGGR